MKIFCTLLACFSLTLHAGLIYYDGQDVGSTYNNTTYDSNGLTYTLANSSSLPVTGGKRIVNGGGDGPPLHNEYLPLDLSPTSTWAQAGLVEGGLVGGGNVSGTLYFSVLLRAQNAAGGATEPSYSAFEMNRSGGGGRALGAGNFWNAWAFSIFGSAGEHNLLRPSDNAWFDYDTNAHWMVGKITFVPGGNDSVTVWLDPNPDDGDSQGTGVYTTTASGNLSFDQIAYRAGNTAGTNAWDFDEARFGTEWADMVSTTVVPEPASASLMILAFSLFLLRRR